MSSQFLLRHVRFRIHPCFWLVVVLAIWGGYFLEMISLFALVLIHELGHVAAARYFGWRITEITLLPFGGVAKTDEWGTVAAREEMLVAVAGPAFNGVMIVFGAICYVFGWWSPEWAHFFVTANMWLGGFNLLPITPLDGGKILQAAISYKWPYRKCITATLWLSMVLTCGIFIVSWLPLLFDKSMMLNVLILSVFLFLSNVWLWRQKNYQYMRFLMQRQMDRTVQRKPVDPIVVSSQETLLSTVREWKKEHYHVFIIRDHAGNVVRVMSEEALLQYYFTLSSPRQQLGELI